MIVVYGLFRNGLAVYIGVTGSFERRKKQHRAKKDFKELSGELSFGVLESYHSRYEARKAEKRLIIALRTCKEHGGLNQIFHKGKCSIAIKSSLMKEIEDWFDSQEFAPTKTAFIEVAILNELNRRKHKTSKAAA